MMQFVEFQGPHGTLRGALHLPTGAGGHPGVVICHGCTGQRMESSFLFVELSRRLEAAGVASLRFDFHGSGESDGDFSEMTVTSERADAMAAIDFFKAHGEIDPDRVGLLGLSLGGYVTACVLGVRADVRAAATWSATGKAPGQWLKRFPPDQLDHLKREGWVDVSGLRMSAAFFGDLDENKPYDLIAAYRGPVLVVHGTEDLVVPMAEAERYVSVLRARPDARCESLFVDGAGHTFSNWEHRQIVYARTVAWFRDLL